MKRIILAALTASMLFMVGTATARNYPCSGKKGGVSHCHNGKFVCMDGTISKSKKICK